MPRYLRAPHDRDARKTPGRDGNESASSAQFVSSPTGLGQSAIMKFRGRLKRRWILIALGLRYWILDRSRRRPPYSVYRNARKWLFDSFQTANYVFLQSRGEPCCATRGRRKTRVEKRYSDTRLELAGAGNCLVFKFRELQRSTDASSDSEQFRLRALCRDRLGDAY